MRAGRSTRAWLAAALSCWAAVALGQPIIPQPDAYSQYRELATPTVTPPSGQSLLYVKPGAGVCTKNSAGTETCPGGGGGGSGTVTAITCTPPLLCTPATINTTGSVALGSLTDTDIPDTITASDYLPLVGGTLTGPLNATTGADPIVWGSRTVKGRLSANTTTDIVDFSSNVTTAGVQDDVSKPSWMVRLRQDLDVLQIIRKPPGAGNVGLVTVNNNGRLTLGADPTGGTDAATKQYVDNRILPLANLTDTATAGLCLVSGGAGGDPNYATCPGGGSVSLTCTAPLVCTPTPITGTGVVSVGTVDISSTTNLAVTAPITLTGDTVGLTTPLPIANGGTNLTTATDDAVMVGNGTTWQSKALPTTGTSGCSGATDKLLYNTSTNTWSCGVDAGAGGGGVTVIKEDNVNVTTAATALDFAEPDATIVTSATGESEVNLAGYARLAGRAGSQQLNGGSASAGSLVLAANSIGDGIMQLYAIETDLTSGVSATAPAFRFFEAPANGANFTELKNPANTTSTQTYIWPNDVAAEGDFLRWHTGGQLSWDGTTSINDTTWGDGTDAAMVWAFDPSGTTQNPTLAFSDATLDLTANTINANTNFLQVLRNTAGKAELFVNSASGSTGDAQITAHVTTSGDSIFKANNVSADWVFGLDQSDGNNWKLSEGFTLGAASTDRIVVNQSTDVVSFPGTAGVTIAGLLTCSGGATGCGGGGGTVTGTGTDNHVLRWDGTTAAQDSSAILSDTGDLTVTGALTTALPLVASETAVAATGTGSGTGGDSLTLTAQTGQATTDATGDTGGTGGSITLRGGNGGTAPAGSTNGAGGNVTLRMGTAGAGAGGGGGAGLIALQDAAGTNRVLLGPAGGLSINTNPQILDGQELQLEEIPANGSNYTGWKAPAIDFTTNRVYEMPSDTPADGDVLAWHTGNLTSWDPASAGAGGDAITVNGAAATDANFLDGNGITATLNTAPTPDTVTIDLRGAQVASSTVCSGTSDASATVTSELAAATTAGKAYLLPGGCKIGLGSPGAGAAAVTVPAKATILCQDKTAGFVAVGQVCVNGTYPGAACATSGECGAGGTCSFPFGSTKFAPTGGSTYTMLRAATISDSITIKNCSFWTGQATPYQRIVGGTNAGNPCRWECGAGSSFVGVTCNTLTACGGSGSCLRATAEEGTPTGTATCTGVPLSATGAGKINPLDFTTTANVTLTDVTVYDHFVGDYAVKMSTGGTLTDVDIAAASDGCTSPITLPTGSFCATTAAGACCYGAFNFGANVNTQPTTTVQDGILTVNTQPFHVLRGRYRGDVTAINTTTAKAIIEAVQIAPDGTAGPGTTGGGIKVGSGSAVANSRVGNVEANGAAITVVGSDTSVHDNKILLPNSGSTGIDASGGGRLGINDNVIDGSNATVSQIGIKLGVTDSAIIGNVIKMAVTEQTPVNHQICIGVNANGVTQNRVIGNECNGGWRGMYQLLGIVTNLTNSQVLGNRFVSVAGAASAVGGAGLLFANNYINASGLARRTLACDITCANGGEQCFQDSDCTSCSGSVTNKCIPEPFAAWVGDPNANNPSSAHHVYTGNLLFAGGFTANNPGGIRQCAGSTPTNPGAICETISAAGTCTGGTGCTTVLKQCDSGTRQGLSCTTDDTNATTGCPGATCPTCCDTFGNTCSGGSDAGKSCCLGASTTCGYRTPTPYLRVGEGTGATTHPELTITNNVFFSSQISASTVGIDFVNSATIGTLSANGLIEGNIFRGGTGSGVAGANTVGIRWPGTGTMDFDVVGNRFVELADDTTGYKGGYGEFSFTSAMVSMASDQVGAGTSLADVPALTFPIGANRTYEVYCHFLYTTTTTTGIGLALNGPAGASAISGRTTYCTTACNTLGTDNYQALHWNAYNDNNPSTVSVASFTNGALIEGMVVNGATAGNLVVRLRNGASGTATLKAGSYCRVQQMAKGN